MEPEAPNVRSLLLRKYGFYHDGDWGKATMELYVRAEWKKRLWGPDHTAQIVKFDPHAASGSSPEGGGEGES